MAYKCRICGLNDVDHQGDICELCAIGQDPYASAMQGENWNAEKSAQGMFQSQNGVNAYTQGKGRSRKILIGGMPPVSNVDPYGNSIIPQSELNNPVQVYQAGQIPAGSAAARQMVVSTGNNRGTYYGGNTNNKNVPLTSGITKNITVDTQKKYVFQKLFRSLFQGIPYTLDNDITMFQVFPDYTGTSLNAMGNACDQIIVYGKLNAGAVAENNDVDIYGRRDSDNNIVAKKIVNKASGTIVTPDRVITVPVIWGITIVVFALLAIFIAMFGGAGIVWAVILFICLTNLPLIFKIFAAVCGYVFSAIRRM